MDSIVISSHKARHVLYFYAQTLLLYNDSQYYETFANLLSDCLQASEPMGKKELKNSCESNEVSHKLIHDLSA